MNSLMFYHIIYIFYLIELHQQCHKIVAGPLSPQLQRFQCELQSSRRSQHCLIWSVHSLPGRTEQVSISPTFYQQLFCTKVFFAAFMCSQFRFVCFGKRKLAPKAACKVFVKLATVDPEKAIAIKIVLSIFLALRCPLTTLITFASSKKTNQS